VPPARDSSRDLLLGLLALQTGLINQAPLVAAFHAWTQARNRTMAEILVEQGALETSCLALVEGLVIEHLRRHESDPERSLAAIGIGRSTRECLARISDAELDTSLAHVGSISREADDDPDCTASYAVGTTTSDGQRFRVLRPHARGGLGVVFVALDSELNREVALKQIKPAGADDPQSRARFLIEAEITGGLEHPGIVPVYGLGHDADGRPYYAMRLIRGESLQQAIDHFHSDAMLRKDVGRWSLELRKLLRRFLDVCNSIEYAHSRGVLHRDLKPSNVILGQHGETLVVDWGMAKAMGKSEDGPASEEWPRRPPSANDRAETLPGSVLGTPNYMSPEQAAGNLDRLGPRSDVYSLGATLYCLLTGKPPLEGDAGDVLRKAQAGDVPPPRVLYPSIDRALEAVCLKAMALEPEVRYGSCTALAEDVERWLADERVTAWHEPLSRRARRWARRHRTAVAAVSVALVAGLIGLSAVAAVQAQSNMRLRQANAATGRALDDVRAAKKETEEALARSEESRRQAEAVSKFLVDAFRSPDPTQDGRQIKVVDLLDRAAGNLDVQFDVDSRIKAELLRAVAQTYFGLGLYPRAVAAHEKAWSVRKRILGPEHPDAIRSMADLGEACRAAYRTTEGIPLLEEALKLQKAKLGSDHADTLESMRNLAGAYYYAGRISEAIALTEHALELQKRKAGPNHPLTLDLISRLSYMNKSARIAGELPLLKETLKLQEAILGPGHPDTIGTMIRLADASGSLALTNDSVRLLQEALKLGKENLGPDHPVTLWAMTRLIDAYGEARRPDDSIAIGVEALKLAQARHGPDNPHTLHTVHVLAKAYQRADRLDRSIALWEEAFKRSTERLAPNHPDTIAYRQYLAHAYVAAGRCSEAEPLLREMLTRPEAEKPDSPLTDDQVKVRGDVTMLSDEVFAADLALVGLSLLEQSKWLKAEPILRECLAIRQKVQPDEWTTFDTRSMLGQGLLGQGKCAEAEPLIVSGYEGMKTRQEKISGMAKLRLGEAADRIIRLYEAWGKPDKTDAWKRKLGLADLPAWVLTEL
jgi:serine/threonine protein kinase/tetratricopeptide (TPR) repeat protein